MKAPEIVVEKLDKIEQRLEKLENKRRDAWDVLLSLGAVLIPGAIALAGYLISHEINRAQVDVAISKARVEQADLVRKFIPALVSSNKKERSIASESVVYAIPEYGAILAHWVARTDEDSDVRSSTEDVLHKRLDQLIRELYSEIPQVRISAANKIVQGWYSVPELVPSLLEYAKDHSENENGIYNTVVILNSIDRNSLLKHKDGVNKFLAKAKDVGPKTKQLAEQVSGRLING